MKKLLLSALLLSFYGLSQDTPTDGGFVAHAYNSTFFKTAPIRSLIGTNSGIDESAFVDAAAKDAHNTNSEGLEDIGIPENGGMDPALQTEEPIYKSSTSLKANFDGLSSNSYPPDPSGAAGPEYYVQAINTSYKVYSKDGGTSGAWFHSLSFLWPGSTSDGDPIVMYDRYAERWFISQFQPDSDEILIAISETSDPLGSYFAYSFTVPVGGASFPDYPKFGIWPNGYYMSANCSSNNCVVFEREKMLLGDQAAGMILMNFPSMAYWFRSVAPAYAEGQTEPEADEPFYYFHIQDNSWSGVSADHIKVLKCEVDWSSPSSSTILIHQSINTTAFNSIFGSGNPSDWNNIVQKGTTQKLDAIPGIFMYRAQYRRFEGYNTMMLCTTVDVNNNDIAGIRWFELRDDNDGVWYIHQEGTYSPEQQNSRWLGNIAMDCFGNIALAYSFAGSDNYAGIRYTGRFKDDPLNEMTVQEQIAVEGLSSQTVTNRFGDYSQMTMDPADDYTFWYTGEYIGSGGSRKTRIFSFSSWHLLGEDEPELTNPFFNVFQPTASSIKLEWNSLLDEEVVAELIDMSGKVMFSEQINTLNNEKTFEVPGFAKGIYLIKLTGKNTNLTKKIYLS